MFGFILQKFLGTQNDRAVKNLAPRVEAINTLEPLMKALSDDELKAKTPFFKEKINKAFRERCPEGAQDDVVKKIRNEILNEILSEAFAVVREVSRRTIGLRHYDVQMIGGMVLHEGGIAEMATGEGKTLVATLPVYLNALWGFGVHVVTVNDYLAQRDRVWMGSIYEFLGLTIGVIYHDMDYVARQEAYRCDIVYGTNNEFGFDYLRDNMVVDKRQMVQRPLHYAIVDEVDSILIDEARTPLIISGPTDDSVDKYYVVDRIIPKIKRSKILEKDRIDAKYKGEDITVGFDAVVDEKNHTVELTDQGITKCEELLAVKNIYDDLEGEWVHHIRQAIKAYDLFERDVDYVVKEGKVIIVDEFTGRLMPGRRWSDGMHQAVEAKERLRIERENQTLATITLQNYFRLYEKLAGMTGTAITEASEFKQIYKLDVVVIPTNRPLIRTNHSDSVFKTQKAKYKAVVEEIRECYTQGRPVLVGTTSIEKSELLSSFLKKEGIPHEVLNAKYHEREASIVAQAGRFKAVTISTNMAGRGTDILLGGNPEFMAKNIIEAKDIEVDDPQYLATQTAILDDLKKQTLKEHNQVVAAGGLHVICTGRHEARRIDNQLRGRSGRQGDPGSSRFYVSLDDDLMRLFGQDRLIGLMDRLGMDEDMVIEHPLVSRSIETAQKRVEGLNFEIRKQLLEYDDVMNKQREVIYAERRRVLEEETKEFFVNMVEEVLSRSVQRYFSDEVDPSEWNWSGFEGWIRQKCGAMLTLDRLKIESMKVSEIQDYFFQEVLKAYEMKEQDVGAESLRQLERMVMLHVIDTRWKEHLYSVDSLKEGIGLRAYGARDPLLEYQREAFVLFAEAVERIQEEVVELAFRMQITENRTVRSVFSSLPQRAEHSEFSGLDLKRKSAQQENVSGVPDSHEIPPPKREPMTSNKVGRNDLCPCGSGKKFKKCCG